MGMARNLDTNLHQRRKRAIRFGEELGKALTQFSDIAEDYVAGASLSELASSEVILARLESCSSYDRNEDLNNRVAGVAIRKCLELSLGSERLREIGREHMEDTAYDRGMEGVVARGHVPYANGKFIILGNRICNEIGYIDFLRGSKQSWETIVRLLKAPFSLGQLKEHLRLIQDGRSSK
jgi:hypothetical protein